MKHKSIKPIEVTMIGDHFVLNKTAKKPQEPQKPSYLEVLIRSENNKATSVPLESKTPAQASPELQTKLLPKSKRKSEKLQVLKPAIPSSSLLQENKNI